MLLAKRRTWTVQGLAHASGLEPEVTLVALWAEGIEYVDEPSSRVRLDDTLRAERAVGIGGSRARLVSYWEVELGLGRDAISAYLAEEGFTLHPRARTLPKGAIKRLGRYQQAHARGIVVAEPKPLEKLEWRQIGHSAVAEHLEFSEVEQIHWALERDFAAAEDPISPAGIRSADLLSSAIERPQTSFMGEPKYLTIPMCAAALTHSLIHNHPFHNGNKRTALVALLVLLDRNDIVLESNEDELFRFFLQIAAHGLLPPDRDYEQLADREVLEIARWINQRSRGIQRGERTVPWRALQRILRDLGCEISQHRGDKLRVTRRVIVRPGAWFRSASERELVTYYTNTGDGREVPKTVLKRMRVELELDEEHNVDSERFYSTRREPDVFIGEYSRLLRRLARV